MCKIGKYKKEGTETEGREKQEKSGGFFSNSSRIEYAQGFIVALHSKCSFRMQKSCLEYIMTSVINLSASSHSQKPGAPERDPESWGCQGFCSIPAILFVFLLFSPDTALKVWHRFPAAGTVLEVLYHSRLPRGQQSSPSWLSRLYSCVTLEEVRKGVIRGQEKAQCRSSRTAWREENCFQSMELNAKHKVVRWGLVTAMNTSQSWLQTHQGMLGHLRSCVL